MLPLDGIKVIALEHAIAAPFATRQLADLGARVIKIERPGKGDFARSYDTRARGMSSHFVWTNRSKESLTLDLKSPEGMDVLSKLIEGADVLVQNLAPGAADRMGLGFETLHEIHSELIVCNISGYGPDGPETNRKAYDLLVQAEAGFLSITGTDAKPSKAGISVADIAAGMYAYTNILAALLQRGKTGLGIEINISMLEALAEWIGYPMYYATDGAEPPARAGAAHATIFPYGPFMAGDGKEVMFGLQNDREWAVFCRDILDAPALETDPRFESNQARAANKLDLTAIIMAAFSEWNAEEVIVRLTAAGIANARMNDMAGLWAHPQIRARDRWREVSTPIGPMPALLPPGGIGAEPRMDAIPAMGEHSRAILEELGIDSASIEALSKARII
ncbi:MAG: CaiB/BaiF CoA-transferase family protein [Planktotalea sp.]|jgi:itaconate CoA-transferase|uniref:CaiB/BaiF CoA transferase family protein n=1 Tax=Planktotalea sp. TaxID=2029877 RepID=UPI00018398D8|nr:CaiB/BaiF CoA-transferase family protein [Planktotalea sp.]EDZ42065.1 L-carnitine dehydratase/bile acid-inducible protein F [Rhodobacteraceae bacterium HTCC2083]MDG1075404.1 CaiB/BaiF CoA-transferase family protein [Planktotalea sp.]MDG1083493.1 CaiB/BaiF CoA-transferase family protein [Planktotalea sp.]HCW84320.1 CoA transferase [Paracoccaceae bacterium]